MAKVCIQCDKKIGLFSSAIEGVYCSAQCRDASRRAIEDNERRSHDRIVEAEKAARDAAAAAAAADAAAKAAAARLACCPKCGAAWRVEPGPSEGSRRGDCAKCGLAVVFKDIEKCPTCTQTSLIVEESGARCPRCKFRRH